MKSPPPVLKEIPNFPFQIGLKNFVNISNLKKNTIYSISASREIMQGKYVNLCSKNGPLNCVIQRGAYFHDNMPVVCINMYNYFRVKCQMSCKN